MTASLDEVCYTTREHVQHTLDQSDAVRLNARIDECIQAASRDLENDVCRRRFYPLTAVRYPDPRWVSGNTLWLNHIDYEILSLSSLVVDGTTLTANTHYYLDCQVASGAYTAIRLINTSNAAWTTLQRRIVLTGTFGGSDGSAASGALAAAVSTTSATTMTVTDASLVGVGDLVLIDSERVLVTEKAVIDSTATVSGTVASSNATTTVPVSDGTKLHVGEQILIGSERMFIENISGNNLTVKRATNASTLAAHAALDVVYVPRLCTVVRGAAGTTAATHSSAAALMRNHAPAFAREAAHALALSYLEQGKAAYARTVGSGDAEQTASGAALRDVVARADRAYGRHGRIGVA